MISPFARNEKGALKKGELVRIFAVDGDRIILEKEYDITTVEDIDNRCRRSDAQFFAVKLESESVVFIDDYEVPK